MSADGIHEWINTGVSVDPACGQDPTTGCTSTETNFLRYTDGTVNHWYNMERPNVVLENGHVAYFTFAVSDVNKNGSPSPTASKVIVVPFDGVAFDCDNGGEDAGCASDGGGPTTDDGATADGGEADAGGETHDAAIPPVDARAEPTVVDAGVSPSSASASGASSTAARSSATVDGAGSPDSGAAVPDGGPGAGAESTGCSCRTVGGASGAPVGASPGVLLLGTTLLGRRLRKRRRGTCQPKVLRSVATEMCGQPRLTNTGGF